MKWHILGAGAIGNLFATRLLQAGQNVSLILRQPKSDGYYQLHCLEGKARRTYSLPTQSASATETISNLLITTKAYDTETALASVSSRLTPDTTILLLQNGMGQHDAVLQRYPSANLWAGVTTAGAWRPNPDELICVAAGETHIGPLNTHATQLPVGWAEQVPAPTYKQDIQTALWRKLAINCAINPLTALHGCHNGALIENPGLYQQMQLICAELDTLTRALDIPLFATDLIDQAANVAQATAGNRSSMLEDITHGRPTEIEFITGHVCQQADQLGIDLPCNKALLSQVRALSAT
ncbi:ketopantoate reductase family protein [Nitrincola sp.]|uniref:ketopantoate reductase family protein n=1 Tax=Nitrincola sp. TaxID=1926584 RepID=UPI003A906364